MTPFFFTNWETLGRILFVGVLAYVALAISLRFAGKRILARMDSFDFVGNVALGSTLAAIVLTPTISLAEGLAAFVVLVGIPFLINLASARQPSIRTFLNSEPTMLMHRATSSAMQCESPMSAVMRFWRRFARTVMGHWRMWTR